MEPPTQNQPPMTPETEALLAKLAAQAEAAEKRAAAAEAKLQWADLRIEQLQERLRLLLIKKYGPHAESLSALQLRMFEQEPSASLDEVAAEAGREPAPEAAPAPQKRERGPHPGRQELPEHLPRVETVIACAPSQCRCANCGQETAVIGYEESQRLDMEPPRFFVAVTRREKRACSHCRKGGVTVAAAPARIVEKSLLSDRLAIETVVAKYCEHMPLYRQSARLARDAGLEVSRSTLDGVVMKIGELLGPIAQAMRREILTGTYIQADETTVDVQRHETKKGRNHQAYLWQFGNPRGTVVFDFRLTRGGVAAQEFLRGFRGLLQTDGYGGYNDAGGPAVVRAGCWAHARRGFVEALQANRDDETAADFVRRMDLLFAVDREAGEAKMTAAARHELRQERSRRIVDEIREKLLAEKPRALPQSKLGQAVNYAVKQWHRLVLFLEHPELELSNNLAENSMRPAVLGRKNWLHVGSVDAGPKVAAILSVVETCRRIGVPVRDYMADVLPGLANRHVAEAKELTPMAWKLRREA
jgi:transposase